MLSYMIGTTLYVLREDYKSGRIKDPWRSRLRTAGVLLRLFAYITPRLIKAMAPKYDPIDIPPPRRCMEVLAETEAKWTRAAGKPAGA